MRLEGRVAVVTGAASGIGRATAQALARAGCTVAVADIDGPGAAAVANAIGGKATAHELDVSNRAAVFALAADVQRLHGGAHIVINNAGVTVFGRFEDHSPADWQRVLGVNLWGVIWGVEAFLPQLRAADAGHVVNVSSVFGIIAVPGQSAYCASKFAVRGLTEALAEELRGTTVGVTVVHPGAIRTNIIRGGRVAEGRGASDDDHAPERARITDYFERKGVPPERVAARIVRAIRREEPRVLVTREAVVADLLRRAAPVFGNRIAVKRLVAELGMERLLKQGGSA